MECKPIREGGAEPSAGSKGRAPDVRHGVKLLKLKSLDFLYTFIQKKGRKLRFLLCMCVVLCAGVCQPVFLPARRYASAGYRDRNVSVRLSVGHAPVLCQNEDS